MSTLTDASAKQPGSGPASEALFRSVWIAADPVTEKYVDEMIAAWQAGQHPSVEDFLAREPGLRANAEATIRLIYEEFCLRQESGQEISSVEIVQRFPQWQAQLEVLFNCHELIQPSVAPPKFPDVGDRLGDYYLMAELGRGSLGRVFLAVQPALADRQIVLKLTPIATQEHLALARLQHTHIVPLYSVDNFSDRNLRALCMPYLGGMTLAHLMSEMDKQSVADRNGERIVHLLDEAQLAGPVHLPAGGSTRKLLASSSYAQAICWLGACLAEALEYAHERGLIHLDLKPSNILLAVDGEPLLLDFHLAHGPIEAGTPAPSWLGGTPIFMSPEQQAALVAAGERQAIPRRVDGRSDIYSLGLVLYEALGGKLPLDRSPQRLYEINHQVSVGLADIIDKCLNHDPTDRYADASTLARDLRRHLENLPMRGVPNRSIAERWRKWRKRQPYVLPLVTALITLVAAVATAGLLWSRHAANLRNQVTFALEDGLRQFQLHHYTEAVERLRRGQDLATGATVDPNVQQSLEQHLHLAERARAAQDLHLFAQLSLFMYVEESPLPAEMAVIDRGCRRVWESRGLLAEQSEAKLDIESEQTIREDIANLTIAWSDLRVRRAEPVKRRQAQTEGLKLLIEGEHLAGPNAVFKWARESFARATDQTGLNKATGNKDIAIPPKTTWEQAWLGMFYLRGGNLKQATEELEIALKAEPEAFWPNYSKGLCALRLGRYGDAVISFCICIARTPSFGRCFIHRGEAYAALGNTDRALADYERAAKLEPSSPLAFSKQGYLYYHLNNYLTAKVNLEKALERGANPTSTFYQLALVNLAQGDTEEARENLQSVLENDPNHEEALKIYFALQGK